jgi:hypothetical protein
MMKDLLILRLITLARQGNLPGFEDNLESLVRKFNDMPETELLTFFELIVLQLHKIGIQ